MGVNFIERLQEYMKAKGINDNQMTVAADLSVGLLGKLKKSGKGMNSANIEKILLHYTDLSSEWLLTGKGEMLTNAKVSYEPTVGVPYYDVDFIGGFDAIWNDQTTIPAHNIVFQPYAKATLWCNVTGRSMEPKINHGDIIALKECTLNDIQYGEIYAVVMDTIRTVKILRKSKDPNKLLFVPVNIDNFDEQEFEKSRIIKVYEVLGGISKFF